MTTCSDTSLGCPLGSFELPVIAAKAAAMEKGAVLPSVLARSMMIGLSLVTAVLGCGGGRPDGPRAGQPCTSMNDCGPREACYERVCRTSCVTDSRCNEVSEHCEDGVCLPGTALECGNGSVQLGEACDDGNEVDGDGCSSQCAVEAGWVCAGSFSTCTRLCGNGIAEGEGCDDGNLDAGDGCSPSCVPEHGWYCSGEPSTCNVLCGDGVPAGTEGCDDGNRENGDGCNAACSAENGWYCTGIPSSCGTQCGDGIIAGDEVCDDGAANTDDWRRAHHCNAGCTGFAPSCGDGAVQVPHEECDDGNSASGDGCESCQLESGWKCHSQLPPCFIVADDCTGRHDFTLCDVTTSPDRSRDVCVNGVCVSPGCGDGSCNVPGPSFALADTNQRSCYDASAEMTSCPAMSSCESTAFCGQDAQYGWDVGHDASERYTKTEPVAGEPLVLDGVTGLMWQGCRAGRTGSSCAGGFNIVFEWEEAVAFCDELTWGGYVDWYLPDPFELQSLIDYGKKYSNAIVIDESAFPRTIDGLPWLTQSYSSSSSMAGTPGHAWGVAFTRGAIDVSSTSSSHPVRCVRSGLRVGVNRYTRSEPTANQPVVVDNITGLVWQGCAAGKTGANCSGTANSYTWDQAFQYCQALDWGGYYDWYLPDVKELSSLLNMRTMSPSIDVEAFPQTPMTSYYWSSSSLAEGPDRAWRVSFVYGWVSVGDFEGGESKGDPYFVRCVRRRP